MNDLRDLVYMLDGFSIENTGFMILEAKKGGDFWSLKVQGYCKELADSTSEDPISTLTLVGRIENKYNTDSSKAKWKVLKVEELEDNMYNLTVKKYREDSKNEENNGSQEKQVETEK